MVTDRTAEVVLPCAELNETLSFFTDRLGFCVESVFPADDPSVVVIAAYGLRLRLERGASGAPGAIRLSSRDPAAVAGGVLTLVAPNGTRVEIVESEPPLAVPELVPSLVVSRASEATWSVGRAGMRYRDLIAGRQGGCFIASHIRIAEGGPVPDYVHFHQVRFQMIYCVAGWVRVVYEDQGEPFELREGDCVLQPPRIRHRVLESSPGLEVIELSCPAAHTTFADPDLALPTATCNPDRVFGGQRFVRHEAASANWTLSDGGFESRDTGVSLATGGLASAMVHRGGGALGSGSGQDSAHDADLLFRYVLAGHVTLHCAAEPHGGSWQLSQGDSCVVPRGQVHSLRGGSANLEFLEVSVNDSASRA